MGVAVLSGVIESLSSEYRLVGLQRQKWESHTPGTLTPTELPEATTPTRFIACVSREQSAKKLQETFKSLGETGRKIEVVFSNNVQAVQQADVILLGYDSR